MDDFHSDMAIPRFMLIGHLASYSHEWPRDFTFLCGNWNDTAIEYEHIQVYMFELQSEQELPLSAL